jgi:hypothetical protein
MSFAMSNIDIIQVNRLVSVVKALRIAQKEYFSGRNSRSLIRAKDLEKEIDRIIPAAETACLNLSKSYKALSSEVFPEEFNT